MELNLVEQIILLALNDDTGEFVSDGTAFPYALAGAVILELSFQEKIILKGKEISIKSTLSTGDSLLDLYLQKCLEVGSKENLKSYIEKLSGEEEFIREKTLERLIQKGILSREESKILWVFTVNKYPSMNNQPENELRRYLVKILEGSKKPIVKDLMLLNLVNVCELSGEVFGKEREKEFKKRIEELCKEDVIAQEIGESVQEIQTMLNTLLFTSVATTIIFNS